MPLRERVPYGGSILRIGVTERIKFLIPGLTVIVHSSLF
jgi:hypothetical protein